MTIRNAIKEDLITESDSVKTMYKKGIVEIRESMPADILAIKDCLRKEEVEEVWASNNATPEQALSESFKRSTKCFTFLVEGKPAAMFGIAPDSLASNSASVWFLGTDDMGQAKKTFMVQSRRFINLLLKEYPVLYNFVDYRYKKTLQWLEWCGAKIFDPVPYGRDQLPFCRIELKSA
jgi:hypothetical protein